MTATLSLSPAVLCANEKHSENSWNSATEWTLLFNDYNDDNRHNDNINRILLAD